MSAVISPLVYATLIVCNDLVSLVVPTADLLQFVAHSDASPGASPLPDAVVAVLAVAALVLPGSIVMLLAWIGARTLFARHGTHALLKSLGAREPKLDDLEERHLQNLVSPGGHRPFPVRRDTWRARPFPSPGGHRPFLARCGKR